MFLDRFILLFTIILFSVNCFGQKDSVVYFFDADGGICTKEKAYYIAKGTMDKDALMLSFYVEKTGILVMEASYTDSTLAVKNGFFALYSEDGKGILKRGNYINNIEDGYWVEWGWGHMTDSVLFENGKDVVRITFSYHETGQLSNRIANDSRTKTSELTFYDESGNLTRHTKWINGTGDQVYYYPTGQVKMVQKYKDKKVISTTNYDTDGKEIAGKEVQKNDKKNIPGDIQLPTGAPEYPGGWAGFSSFFNRNFKVPASYGRDGFSDIVTITFYLDKSGFANNIRVSGSNNRDIETEVMTVFRRMAAWNMKGHTSYGPITYTLSLN